jgi:hypothetical protein
MRAGCTLAYRVAEQLAKLRCAFDVDRSAVPPGAAPAG